jgi:S-formylglutathione hydrolase
MRRSFSRYFLKPWSFLLAASAAVLLVQAQSAEQVSAGRHGKVEQIKVHGKTLEGNLEGDSPDRDVSVYLPSGYEADTNKRYPVIYMLHGYTDSAAKWFGAEQHWINLPKLLDQTFESSSAREAIVVMPDAYTRFKGSMYSNSITTGDWEDFVAQELVSYVDSHYRTMAQPASRGLAGHSMGGYGTMRIAMKHPGIFSSIYLLSPCCMAAASMQPSAEMLAKLQAIHAPEDVAHADFFTSAITASAAAWAPDPKNPPLYLDLPFKNGQMDPVIAAKFAANAPLAMVDQYIPNIRKLHAIAFDAGTKDEQIAGTIKVLDQVLNNYGIAHTYETYDGTHISRIGERIQTKMLPFFSSNLAFQ